MPVVVQRADNQCKNRDSLPRFGGEFINFIDVIASSIFSFILKMCLGAQRKLDIKKKLILYLLIYRVPMQKSLLVA